MSRKRSIIHLLSSLKTAYAGIAGCQSTLAGTAAPSRLSLRKMDGAGPARFRPVARTYTTTTDAETAEKDTIHIADEVYNRQRSVLPLLNRIVHAAPSAYIAPSAVVVGDVDIFERVRVYHNVVIRGDLNAIRIHPYTSIGDRSVIHAAVSTPTGLSASTIIGQHVLVGQGCLLRSVNIGDGCIIGDRSILLEGSRMEEMSVLEPNSVVPPGRVIPTGQVWGGSPAQFVRALTKDEKMDMGAGSLAEKEGLVVDGYYGDGIDGQGEGAWVEAVALRDELKEDCAVRRGAELERITEKAL